LDRVELHRQPERPVKKNLLLTLSVPEILTDHGWKFGHPAACRTERYGLIDTTILKSIELVLSGGQLRSLTTPV
jgi:hypothetical protein